MARARNIKPGLFKNEVLGVADPLYTLLFEGLWLLADRAGRLEDRPLKIKGELFPHRAFDVDAAINWLQEQGFVLRYEVDGRKYIFVLEFAKHQNPHKNEPKSDIPPPEGFGTTSENVGSTRADSGFLIPDSGLLEGDAPPPPKPKKAETDLPPNFAVSQRVQEWADRNGYGQLGAHLEAFVLKAQARRYRYADWDAAFMGAIREDWAKLRAKRTDGTVPPPDAKARGPDPALEKIKRDAERAAPAPQAIREQMAKLTGKLTGKEAA